MVAQQLNVDTIAHNLANVNTAGYKRSRVDFQDILYQTLRAPGSISAEGVELPTGLQVGLGTRVVATQRIMAPGTPQPTENALDLLINGDGFFQVSQRNGDVAYTRAGSFRLDGSGNVVTADGFPLDPPINIPVGTRGIAVGWDGTESGTQPGTTDPSTLGSI